MLLQVTETKNIPTIMPFLCILSSITIEINRIYLITYWHNPRQCSSLLKIKDRIIKLTTVYLQYEKKISLRINFLILIKLFKTFFDERPLCVVKIPYNCKTLSDTSHKWKSLFCNFNFYPLSSLLNSLKFAQRIIRSFDRYQF